MLQGIAHVLFIRSTQLLNPVDKVFKGQKLLYQQLFNCCCCACSVYKLYPTCCDPMDCNMPGSSVLRFLLKLEQFISTELVMISNHPICCCPLLLLPSIIPSIMIFSSESILCIKWPKCWRFNFNISPSNEYLGIISFGIHCFHLLPVQGTVESLLQHRNSKTSILQCSEASVLRRSVFIMV